MLDRIHKISEIVAAFAIVGSLIFVGIQMQLNTKAIRISAGQGMISTWAETNRDVSNDPSLADHVWQIVVQDTALPEGPEGLRVRLWAQNAIRQAEFNYFNWQNGNLAERYWVQSKVVLAQFLRTSAGRLLWEESKVAHDPQFQAAMDEAIQQSTGYAD